VTELTVEVATLAALGSRTDLDNVIEVDYRTRLNEVGDGGFVVPYGVTLPSDPLGQVVFVKVDDADVGAFVVEGRRDVLVGEGEEAVMVTEFDGRSMESLLDRVRVAPTLGYERSPWALSRTWSAFSLGYDDTAWVAATTYATLLDDTPHWNGVPTGFPGFDVFRIGPSEGTTDEAPQGYWWTRKTFTTLVDQLFQVFIAADNAADVYFDGFRLATIDPGTDTTAGFTKAKRYTLFVTAGTHVFGAKVINTDFLGVDPGYGEGPVLEDNPTFFMSLVFSCADDGRFLNRVDQTDADWVVLSYPDAPPGMTDPEVVAEILAESAADVEFTLTVHGEEWDRHESITRRVGSSLLDYLRDRSESGFFDWYVDGLDLHLYPAGELGSATAVEYTTENGNLLGLTAQQVDVGMTGLAVAHSQGWSFVGTEGRVGVLETRDADPATAKDFAARYLARDPQPEQVDAAIEPVGGDIPGLDVQNGDTVTVGSFVGEKVIGWSVRLTDDGPAFDLELKNRIRGDAERLEMMVSRGIPGQAGGTAASQPAGDPPDIVSKVDESSLSFQPLPPYELSTSPAVTSEYSGNLYAVKVEARKSAGTTDTSFEYRVDGVDANGGTGILPAGEVSLVIPVDGLPYVRAHETEVELELKFIGDGVDGLIFTGLYV
jgi:hypothetical protein